MGFEGKCPWAAKLGFTEVPAYKNTSGVCKSLNGTCCEAKSMMTFKTNFKSWAKSLGKTLWTLLRIPTLSGVIMGNLKSSKCAAAAEAKKTDAKKADDKKADAKNPAAAATKRILQALKVGGKAKVGGSVKLGGKAKIRGKAKVGLKVKAGGKAKLGGKAKIGGKAKLGLKVGGKASLKVKAPKVKVGGKASLKVGGKAK